MKVWQYGTIMENNNQLFKIYDRFNAGRFVEYLKESHWKYGKIAIVKVGVSYFMLQGRTGNMARLQSCYTEHQFTNQKK